MARLPGLSSEIDIAEFVKIAYGAYTAVVNSSGQLTTIDANSASALTALQLIDDCIATLGAAIPAKAAQIAGHYHSTKPTAVDTGDAVTLLTDAYGRLLPGVEAQAFQATFTSADAQAASPVKTKTASRKMYILSLVASTDTALNLQFQDDTGPTVLIENLYFAANGGCHLTWPPQAPLVVNTNEDFDVIASAAGNISVTITGYLAV